MPEAEVRLVSGEAVNLDIRLARAGSRALALMIDIVIQIGLLYVLLIFVGLGLLAMGSAADPALAIAMQIIVFVIV